MSGRTMGRYIAPGGTVPYRPSIFDIQGAHVPLRPRKTQRDKVLANEMMEWLGSLIGSGMVSSLCFPLVELSPIFCFSGFLQPSFPQKAGPSP